MMFYSGYYILYIYYIYIYICIYIYIYIYIYLYIYTTNTTNAYYCYSLPTEHVQCTVYTVHCTYRITY